MPAQANGRRRPPGSPSRARDRREHFGLDEYLWVRARTLLARMRSVLDGDLTHRAARLTTGGLGALWADLHQDVRVDGSTIRIDKPHHNCQYDLSGSGLQLVPSVFAWPKIIVGVDTHTQPALTYGARGVGRVWEQDTGLDEGEPLGALMGRTRALILARLALPLSTTRLAAQIGYSPPAVSQHLAVLRRCGLVSSWRAGLDVRRLRPASLRPARQTKCQLDDSTPSSERRILAAFGRGSRGSGDTADPGADSRCSGDT
jgi:DNA-binding transcriptional ArsR family regulator